MPAPFENALREAMRLLGALALPLLGALLAAGLIAGFLQGATRVRDRSLSTVPRLLAVGAIVLVCGGWAATRLVAFSTSMFGTAIQVGKRR
ncbi:MAG: flagellar biosynthetic protein FliQ [Polyangia bacterium]